MTVDEARALLLALDFVYGKDDDMPNGDQILNMNDVWGWATAWGEEIPDDELPAVGYLAKEYGWCGVLYWVSTRHANMRSEFEDVNRMVEFVRHEERIKQELPGSSERAYAVRTYTLGAKPMTRLDLGGG